MRIAFIITSLANKGPILMVRSLVRHLVENGCFCDVYYFDSLLDLQFPCKTMQIAFTEKFDFSAYDIIHSHLFRPDLYCAYHNRALRESKAKWITTIHTAIYDDLKYTYGKLIARLIIPLWKTAWRKVDHAVVLTEAAKAYYKSSGIETLSIIPNGIDLPANFEAIAEEDIQLIQNLKKHHTLLGTVCAIDKRKGLEQIISLLSINRKYSCIVVGDGLERTKLEALALLHNVSERFKVIGFRPDGYRYMPCFDLFLMTSRSEGMPLALLEAIALKVPVVCSAIPALQEFSGDELSLFQLDDIINLQKACEFVHSNAESFIKKAHLKYQNLYTANQMGINYRKLYDSLINIV